MRVIAGDVMTQPRIHIVAGPTASGKSARALALAKEHDGIIINADASQMYEELQILSARPTDDEMQGVAHRLYGIIRGDAPSSAGSWLRLAKEEIIEAWKAKKLPILCGGTGLYLKALTQGMSYIPPVGPEIRAEVEALLAEIGNEALHAKLAEVDPVMGEKLLPTNTQRLIRAYEVWYGTGTALSEWQSKPHNLPFPEAEISTEIIEWPRDELYARCDARFDLMIEKGAVKEVEQLLEQQYDPVLPIMKAVGVPEIAGYLRREYPFNEAVEIAKRNTRRYAKRQLTWLRNQL